MLLSGLGPRAQLERHGIPVLRDIPGVGENLQDHLFAPMSHEDVSATSYSTAPSMKLLYAIYEVGCAS